MGLRFDRPRPEGVRSAHTVVLHVVVMVAVSGGVAGVGSAAADADRSSYLHLHCPMARAGSMMGAGMQDKTSDGTCALSLG